MNSEIKNKLKKFIGNKEILDIIIFGSAIKGKSVPRDVDIAIITDKVINLDLKGFHISYLKPIDFFLKRPSLVHTLFREGYSLKYNKAFSELYGFDNRVLFRYQLNDIKPSLKVKIVNFLRGKKNEEGLVKKSKGEWLANQIFIVPLEADYVLEKFFLNFNIKFKKFYILMH